MDIIEIVIRALIFVITITCMYFAFKALRGAFRWLRGASVESLARTAGKATAAVERKTAATSANITRAFRQGRGKP